MKKIKLLEECRSWKWDGHIVDTGPHIFHTSNKELWKFWKKKILENCLSEENIFSKNVINNDFNKKYDYPLSIEGINKFDKDLKKN